MRMRWRPLPIVLFLLAMLAPSARGAGTAPRLALWAETSANLVALSTREGIAAMLDRAKGAGVTVIIPEAKNAWGFVTYESTFVSHIRTLPVPRQVPPEYPAPNLWYPPDFDQLRVMIEEAHARGIQVHAAVDVFSEGLNAARVGLAFERPEWQTQHLTRDGRLVPSSEVGTLTFVNPVLPEVQLYELGVIEEIVRNYDVDGLVLDRVRFPDATADFSPTSRERFETWLGRSVQQWPDEVLSVNGSQVTPGPLFKFWVAWRATVIQQFIRAAEHVVHTIKPDVAFAAYVGGWYPTYWQEGMNWAAASSTVDYTWLTPEWRQAAVADLFDYLLLGLYYPNVSQIEAILRGLPPWMSVEGGALLAREVVGDATRPIASLLLSQYEGTPERFREALDAVLRLTGGIMLFDLVYLERYNWWPYLNP